MTKTLQERKAEAWEARGEERGINMKLKQLKQTNNNTTKD